MAETSQPAEAAAAVEKKEPVVQPGPNAVDISPEKDGGVFKEILRKGEGDEGPAGGDKVFVHYVGTLLDGTKFDSSRDRGDQFEFTLGKGQVIKAWDIGVATMKKGELCILTCKPEYAYGEMDKGGIPPNSTLVFEVELFDWKGEDISEAKDEGVVRSKLKEGEGFHTPNEGATVHIHLIGRHNKVVFEDKDVDFTMGEGCESGIVEGVEMALKKFKKGETSKLCVKAKYAYGELGRPEPYIPPNADLEFEVTLKDFEKVKEFWEMDKKEKLEQSDLLKEKGTNYFKAGKYSMAKSQYKKVLDCLDGVSFEEEEEDRSNKSTSLKLAAHLNMAMCHLKVADYLEAKKHCDQALELDPNSEKGYFRRGTANHHLQDYKDAVADFKKVLEIDVNNKAAKNQLVLTQNEIKKCRQKEKQLYGGMFQKFAEKDEKLEKMRGKSEEGTEADESSNEQKDDKKGEVEMSEESSCDTETTSETPSA